MGISVEGTEELYISLRRLSANRPAFLREATDKWGEEVREMFTAKDYPAELPNQKYIRRYMDGGLQGSFTTGRIDEETIFIGNEMEAAGYVIGGEQAYMHVDRWWRMLPIVSDELDNLIEAVDHEIERIW